MPLCNLVLQAFFHSFCASQVGPRDHACHGRTESSTPDAAGHQGQHRQAGRLASLSKEWLICMPCHTHCFSLPLPVTQQTLTPAARSNRSPLPHKPLPHSQQQLIAKDNQRLEGAEHASHTHDLIQRLSSQLAYTYKQQQAAAAASISARDVEIVMAQVLISVLCNECLFSHS